MRSPVYRNLDHPFRILGLSAAELIFLCLVLTGGGELAQLTGAPRFWSLVAALLLAFCLYLFRRSLGDLFGRRLLRFFALPRFLFPKLLLPGGRA